MDPWVNGGGAAHTSATVFRGLRLPAQKWSPAAETLYAGKAVLAPTFYWPGLSRLAEPGALGHTCLPTLYAAMRAYKDFCSGFGSARL